MVTIAASLNLGGVTSAARSGDGSMHFRTSLAHLLFSMQASLRMHMSLAKGGFAYHLTCFHTRLLNVRPLHYPILISLCFENIRSVGRS